LPIFFYLLLTGMFHYRIAVLHAKSFFFLQTLVTRINTLYEYILYLSMPSYVLSSCPYGSFTTSKYFVNINHLQNLQNSKIYSVHKPLKEFCVGAFAKLRKATICSVIPVLLSA